MERPAPPSAQPNEFLFHPSNVMLTLLLFGLSVLFVALTLSYVYTRVTMDVPPGRVPLLFLLNTGILLGSSYTMVLARRAYRDDDTAGYIRRLSQTMWLSVGFMVMQSLAWLLLFSQNILLSTSTTTAYLYVISFLHLVHVVAGLPFLYVFLRAARKHMVDPVTVLIYFSDADRRLRLRLLTIYWHFLDVLWIYLVLFFGINYLI
jgi:cytochrome c oxidase subunit 3